MNNKFISQKYIHLCFRTYLDCNHAFLIIETTNLAKGRMSPLVSRHRVIEMSMTLTFGLPKTNAVRSNNMAAESGQIVSHDQ